MRIALAAALLAAMTTDAAACHRFSVWRYPWHQSCRVAGATMREMAHAPQAPSRRVARITPAVGGQDNLPSSFGLLRRHEPALPLPGLTKGEIGFGEADEPTRALVLLRAALEAANGH